MGSAKDIILKPIPAKLANDTVRRLHYSGKVVNNSQLHIGAFYNGSLEGAMSFGPSLDKRKIQGLVRGTGWNEFIELNRMAFSDALPRNSESRAIAVAMRLLRKHAPHLKWVISFADGTQCGDGTIYRASGFVLTGINKNTEIWQLPNGERVASSSVRPGIGSMRYAAVTGGGSGMSKWTEAGAKKLTGFQLRYIYFLDPAYRERLTVPELPYSAIDEAGARMYRGEKITRAGNIDNDASEHHSEEGEQTKPCGRSIDGDAPRDQQGEDGSTPILPLHSNEAADA